jgi:polysaccharide export outer membrane protein
MKSRFRPYVFWAVCVVCATSAWSQTTSTASYKASNDPNSAASGVATTPSGPTTAAKIDDSFVIGAEDVLAISVWKEPEISRSVQVRPDGKISLPLVGEMQATGESPRQLEKQIASKLESFISEPEVTVIVQEIKSKRFNILGMVGKPGSYPLANSTTVLDAIALAGGFRDFAKQKSIYVLRHDPEKGESRLPFNYKEVIQGKNYGQNINLKAGDTVVIP